MAPSWVHAEPFDVLVLLTAAGLFGFVLLDWLRLAWRRRLVRRRLRRLLHADDWLGEDGIKR